MNTTAELRQLVITQQRSMGFAGRQPTMPQVFTFEPIRENKRPNRRKKRFIKVLYPPHQVRRTLPTQKDLAKRLLLFLLSVVVFQIYTATEDDLNLADPEFTGVQETPTTSGESPAPSAPAASSLSVILSPEAESNYSRPLPGGDAVLRSFLACRM
ncbi:radiation-inducible immediate-early gene IEX-1-like [Pristis pectinata]|uniref:radiation-inducible immediate-early gene IEX-1-like n=1 Tax=Pristis pectinata TaxID=685728 RepID=UPI00223D5471|nr:radiation-inducible immediate-early gene IEX-1-like [Pristis pectinata]